MKRKSVKGILTVLLFLFSVLEIHSQEVFVQKYFREISEEEYYNMYNDYVNWCFIQEDISIWGKLYEEESNNPYIRFFKDKHGNIWLETQGPFYKTVVCFAVDGYEMEEEGYVSYADFIWIELEKRFSLRQTGEEIAGYFKKTR